MLAKMGKSWRNIKCNKCGASKMFYGEDEYGAFYTCINCSNHIDIENLNSPKLELHLDDLNKDKTH